MKRPIVIVALCVAVIVVLTLIARDAVLIHIDHAQYLQTRAQIAELQEALALYHADNGFYPTTDQGLYALGNYYAPLDEAWDQDPGMVLPHVSAKKLLDAWGNPYLYESDGNSYELWSVGSHTDERRRHAIVVHSPKSPN